MPDRFIELIAGSVKTEDNNSGVGLGSVQVDSHCGRAQVRKPRKARYYPHSCLMRGGGGWVPICRSVLTRTCAQSDGALTTPYAFAVIVDGTPISMHGNHRPVPRVQNDNA